MSHTLLIGPIPHQGKCGYINEGGCVRIPFTFEGLGSFSEGLAWFLKGQKIGFINEAGEEVIPAMFARGDRLLIASDFHCGLAPVRIGTEERYIDKQGNVRMSYPCGYCSRFVGGIAVVSTKEDGFLVITQEGHIACHLPFGDVAENPYEPDLIKVFVRRDGVIAPTFVNRHGTVVSGPFVEFDDIQPFGTASPFYAPVRSRHNGMTGFLNRQWCSTIPCSFSGTSGFAEGVAGVSTRDYLWGYINADGDWVLAPEYTDARPFHNGTAAVRRGRGKAEKWFVIDKQNQQISSGSYDWVTDLGDGFRCVGSGKSIMVLNPACQVIWSDREE